MLKTIAVVTRRGWWQNRGMA